MLITLAEFFGSTCGCLLFHWQVGAHPSVFYTLVRPLQAEIASKRTNVNAFLRQDIQEDIEHLLLYDNMVHSFCVIVDS